MLVFGVSGCLSPCAECVRTCNKRQTASDCAAYCRENESDCATPMPDDAGRYACWQSCRYCKYPEDVHPACMSCQQELGCL